MARPRSPQCRSIDLEGLPVPGGWPGQEERPVQGPGVGKVG